MKIPVHVLSGFLGVGKTTAVKDLLARRADRERIAVVVNEFGTLGVDGALLSDCASCILKEVPGGCVCCTAMADLEASLEEVCDLVGADEVRPRADGPRQAVRARRPPARPALGAALRREACHHAPRPAAGSAEGVRRERALPGPGRHGRTFSSSIDAIWLRRKRFFEWKSGPERWRRRSCESSARRTGCCRTKSGTSSGRPPASGTTLLAAPPSHPPSWRFLRRACREGHRVPAGAGLRRRSAARRPRSAPRGAPDARPRRAGEGPLPHDGGLARPRDRGRPPRRRRRRPGDATAGWT